jgi:aryl-alcohol dehydrogenase-like predicted oxidoreductase
MPGRGALSLLPLKIATACKRDTPEQVGQNVKAANWALNADDLAEVDKLTKVA